MIIFLLQYTFYTYLSHGFLHFISILAGGDECAVNLVNMSKNGSTKDSFRIENFLIANRNYS